jgi:starvation-inducible DNA-binding protein
MDKLYDSVKLAFATEFSFYLKSHLFHWNVEGTDFAEFHELFNTIYEEVYSSIDPFAEHIRKLDQYVPADFQQMSMLAPVGVDFTGTTALDMCAELLEDSNKISKMMGAVFKMAEAGGEFGLSNFLADRMDAHRKHSWMLRSTLKR